MYRRLFFSKTFYVEVCVGQYTQVQSGINVSVNVNYLNHMVEH